MILGFKTQFPNGRPTKFVQKILACFFLAYSTEFIPKIHSFRKGPRWKQGMSIQFAIGVRTKDYFNFHGGECVDIQYATLYLEDCGLISIFLHEEFEIKSHEDLRELSQEQLLLFAANDGFNSLKEMTEWFFPEGKETPYSERTISGQIIHWTDFKY